ncbi:hypothetical protein EAF04_009935 [Stromatinia cepivora]|nr:hypothetical protein EAF04_009935 [Stromatinia cepivora]
MHLSILLPLYIYPIPGAWDWVTSAISTYPSINFDIIINPNSGPGPINTFPNANYIDGVASLNAFNNTKLLGYVDTAYMHRSVEEIMAEVDTYKLWSTNKPKDIHISGIFFDDCVSNWNSSTSAFMSKIATHTHAVNFTVTFNPGVIADASFFNIADNILMVENTYNAATSLANVDAIPKTLRPKSSVMFHHFTGTAIEQSSLFFAILERGVRSLYITTVEYSSESALWMLFVGAVNAGVLA